MNLHKELGKKAEELALKFLCDQGLTLVQANFYSRFGEIDLVMRDKDDYVFVEVKLRAYGHSSALESITPNKQRKLVKTAQYFMLKLGREVNCRFDAVLFDDKGQAEWLKNIIIL